MLDKESKAFSSNSEKEDIRAENSANTFNWEKNKVAIRVIKKTWRPILKDTVTEKVYSN